MARFRDLNGREWSVTIDPLGMRRVREATRVELGKLLDENLKLLHELAATPVLFCEVLYVLVHEDADRSGISEEMFLRALAGDCLEAAFSAFTEAFADFSPRHRREPLRAMAKKERELAALLEREAVEAVEAIDPAKLLKTLARPTSNGSAGNLPASSELIPPT